MVYRIHGPFFFGAANEVSAVLDRIGQYPREFVLDLSGVPFADTTAAHSLKSFAEKAGRSGTAVTIAGAQASVRRVLVQHGLKPPLVRYAARASRHREDEPEHA